MSRGDYAMGSVQSRMDRCAMLSIWVAREITDFTIGSTNGDPGGAKDLSMLQMD